MVNNHNLLHRPNKWAKASSERKNISALQDKINKMRDEEIKMQNKIKWFKRQLTIDANFKNKLKELYPVIYKEIVNKYTQKQDKKQRATTK